MLSIWTERLTWVTDALGAWFAPTVMKVEIIIIMIVHLYPKTEKCMRLAETCMKGTSVHIKNMWITSSVIKNFGVLLWLYGLERCMGLSRNGPQVAKWNEWEWNRIVIPPNSNTFPDWRRACHVPLVKTQWRPRETTPWALDLHVIWSCILKPRQIDHFRVLLCLCFKTSVSAKPFLWKWVLHAVSFSCKSKSFS